jgi:hypothetical protein
MATPSHQLTVTVEVAIDILKNSWLDLSFLSRENALTYCQKLLLHTVDDHKMGDWPVSMVKLLLQGAPTRGMRREEIVKLVFFFVGNGFNVLCAGEWALSRLAASIDEDKGVKAEETIDTVIEARRIIKCNQKIVRYYDLNEKRRILFGK